MHIVFYVWLIRKCLCNVIFLTSTSQVESISPLVSFRELESKVVIQVAHLSV